MDRLCVALIAFLCAVSSSQDGVSAAEVELRVRPGDNITLYCECTVSTGVYNVWFRNCSHENQPPLIMPVINQMLFPRFTPVWNPSNQSYDLLIENIAESDLGLYFCGSWKKTVLNMEQFLQGEEKAIYGNEVYHHGNVVTRLSFDTSPPVINYERTPGDCGLCWMLLFSLCPVYALLSFACVYTLFRTTAPTETQVPLNKTTTRRSDSREQTTLKYLRIHQHQQSVRPLPSINPSRV